MHSTILLNRLERLYPRRIDLSLDRMERLLKALGNPERRLPPVVHVAGTNGKGSTIAFIRAIAEANNQRVHVYTSPHLIKFHERIVLAGTTITEERLIDCLEHVERVNDGQCITAFEITTAAALVAFSETPADLLLLETGLGGRLDATNVVKKPVATVITSISLDHVSYLGGTISAIAGEKAGILKPNVTCVVAPQDAAAFQVIEHRARALSVPLRVVGRDYLVHQLGSRFIYQDATRRVDLPTPSLKGRHQLENAGTAIATAGVVFGEALTNHQLERGVTQARWPARLEQLTLGSLLANVNRGTEIWLDGGHNVGGSRAVAHALSELPDVETHLIWGMMEARDAGAVISPFKGLVSHVYTVRIPNESGAFSAGALASTAAAEGFAATVTSGVSEALRLSQGDSGRPNRVIIFGSLYLAGHVLSLNATEQTYFAEDLEAVSTIPASNTSALEPSSV